MNKRSLVMFFNPDRRKMLVMGMLLILLWGVYTQAWVFSDKGIVPKPFLFDLIKPFPFWIIGVFVFAPVGIFGNFIDATFGYHWSLFLGREFWGWVINLVYIYILSSLIIVIWDTIRKPTKSQH